MTASDKATLAAAGLLLALGVYAYRKGAAVADGLLSDAKKLAPKINPANPENVVNQAVNAAVSFVRGTDATLGTTAADVFPSAAERQVNDLFGTGAAPALSAPPGGWRTDWIGEGDTTPPPFAPPGFVGSLPVDETKPAIIYRAPRPPS